MLQGLILAALHHTEDLQALPLQTVLTVFVTVIRDSLVLTVFMHGCRLKLDTVFLCSPVRQTRDT